MDISEVRLISLSFLSLFSLYRSLSLISVRWSKLPKRVVADPNSLSPLSPLPLLPAPPNLTPSSLQSIQTSFVTHRQTHGPSSLTPEDLSLRMKLARGLALSRNLPELDLATWDQAWKLDEQRIERSKEEVPLLGKPDVLEGVGEEEEEGEGSDEDDELEIEGGPVGGTGRGGGGVGGKGFEKMVGR